MGYNLAIDFGNSNIKIAYYDYMLRIHDDQSDLDRVRSMHLAFGGDVLPNTAYVLEENTIVGKGDGLENYVRVDKVKRHLMEECWTIYIAPRSKEMTTVEIAAEEYQYIVQAARNNRLSDFDEMIVTVPVCFTEMQRQRIRKAAQQENCPLAPIITEPFAGLFSCWKMLEDVKAPFHVLVFDAGGGTTDMCLFRIEPEGEKILISTIASKGIRFAGDDITHLLYEHCLKEKLVPFIEAKTESEFHLRHLDNADVPDEMKDPVCDSYQKTYSRIQEEVYQEYLADVDVFKGYLSSAAPYPDDKLDFADVHYEPHLSAEVSYRDFSNALESQGIRQTITDAVEEMISYDCLRVSEIDRIIMIGGTSQLPYFRDVLKGCLEITDEQEKERFVDLKGEDMFNAVAVGAAVYLRSKDSRYITRSRVPYDVGILDEKGNFVLLRSMMYWPRETSLACSVMPVRNKDGKLAVKMYQQFNEEEAPCYMGEFILEESEFEERPYFLSLTIDENGVLTGAFSRDNTEADAVELKLTMED